MKGKFKGIVTNWLLSQDPLDANGNPRNVLAELVKNKQSLIISFINHISPYPATESDINWYYLVYLLVANNVQVLRSALG